jgi:NADH dehydrogenase [ubiquinone] 1 alpha subcomplex assembly factor 7
MMNAPQPGSLLIRLWRGTGAGIGGTGGGGGSASRIGGRRRNAQLLQEQQRPLVSAAAASALPAAVSSCFSSTGYKCGVSQRRRPGLLLLCGARPPSCCPPRHEMVRFLEERSRRGLVTSRQKQKQQQQKQNQQAAGAHPEEEDNVSGHDHDDDNSAGENGLRGRTAHAHAHSSPTKTNLWLPPPWNDDARTFVDLERHQHDHPLLYESSIRRGTSTNSTSSSMGVPSFLPKSWDPRVYETSTPLWEHLYHYVVVTGRPLSVATYMRWCLTHPEFGYYNTRANHHSNNDDDDDFDDIDDFDDDASSASSALNRHVIGRDFVTAPELTSLFGECLAVFFASQLERHLRNGAKDGTSNNNVRYRWVECGPGRGTLMRDLLAASAPLHMLDRCESIHLVEASHVLRDAQRQALEELVTTLPVRFRYVTNRKVGTTASDHDDNEGFHANDGSSPAQSSSAPSPVHEITVVWHDAFTDVLQWQEQTPQQKHGADKATSPLLTFGICQEFVDALPVYSFQKTSEGWRERMVDLAMEDDDDDEDDENDVDATGTSKATSAPERTATKKVLLRPRLRVVLAPEVTPPVRTLLRTDEHGWIAGEDREADLGSIVEVNPEGILLVRDMAALIGSDDSGKAGGGGGAALIIDYGGEGSRDSIRAFSRHEQLPFLSLPGLVDVTADVDFAALKHAINEQMPHPRSRQTLTSESSTELDSSQGPLPVRAYGPVTQGEFLMSMGLQERVLAVLEDDSTDDDHAENLYQAMVRLAAPDEMGERFKVLAIVSHDPNDVTHGPPPGFPAA